MRLNVLKAYEPGIRHAEGLTDPNVGREEAQFMLVACSAFVNYLTEKARQAGVDGIGC